MNGRLWLLMLNSVMFVLCSLLGCFVRLWLLIICVSCNCVVVGIWIMNVLLCLMSLWVFVDLLSMIVSFGGRKLSVYVYVVVIMLLMLLWWVDMSMVGL